MRLENWISVPTTVPVIKKKLSLLLFKENQKCNVTMSTDLTFRSSNTKMDHGSHLDSITDPNLHTVVSACRDTRERGPW